MGTHKQIKRNTNEYTKYKPRGQGIFAVPTALKLHLNPDYMYTNDKTILAVWHSRQASTRNDQEPRDKFIQLKLPNERTLEV